MVNIIANVIGSLGGLSVEAKLLSNLKRRSTYYENQIGSKGLLKDLKSCRFIGFNPPVMTLNGDTLVYINEGEVYIEQGVTAIDDVDGNISGNVVIGGDVVDTSVLGQYVITYNISDAGGNAADEITRTVVVVPLISPVIQGLLVNLEARADYYENEANTNILLSNLENCESVVSSIDLLLEPLESRADYYENEDNTKDLLENLENC